MDNGSGDDFARIKVQTIAYLYKNEIPFMEGSIIKYVSAWKSDGGIDDLKKASRLLDFLITLELNKEDADGHEG